MTTQRPSEDFIKALEKSHNWPGPFTFKWIVPATEISPLKLLLVNSPLIEFDQNATNSNWKEKQSKTGKYISVTYKEHFQSASTVAGLYSELSIIKGLISL